MPAFHLNWTCHKWSYPNKEPIYKWVYPKYDSPYRVIIGYEWGDPSEISHESVSNVSILLKSDNKSDIAEFDIPKSFKLVKGDIISIRCNGVVINGFKTGIVQSVDEKTDHTKHVVAYDASILLKNIKCKAEINGIFKNKILIRNPDEHGNLRTLGNIVNDKISDAFIGSWATMVPYAPPFVLDNTGKYTYDGTTLTTVNNGFSHATTHPLDSSQTLPNLMVSDLSLYGAYDKLLNSICGFKVWYGATEEGSLKCQLDYGFVRLKILEKQNHNDLGEVYADGILIDTTKEYIINNIKLDGVSIDPVDEVIVYSNQNNLKGSYIDESLMYSTRTSVYKVEGNYDKDELNWIAHRIYTDRNISDPTYKLTFPAGTTRYRAGEFFGGAKVETYSHYGLGDSTIEPIMPFRGGSDVDPRSDFTDTVWQINEVTISDDGTFVTVGSSYLTIFEMMGNKLQEVTTGIDPTIETISYDSGEITFDPGVHLDILSKPLKLPGNATGEVTIKTTVEALNVTNNSPPRENVSQPYSFLEESIDLDPLEEASFTFGPMTTIPAKYDHADIRIQWQVGCGEEANSYTYCQDLMKLQYKDEYDIYNALATSIVNIGNASDCATIDTLYSSFITTVDTPFNNGSKVDTARSYYSNLYSPLFKAAIILDWLQNIDYFVNSAASYNLCKDDMCNDPSNIPCKAFITDLTAVRTIIQTAYNTIFDDAYDYFCPSKCASCTGIEINNVTPKSTTGRNACDICTMLDTYKDDFDDFVSAYASLVSSVTGHCNVVESECTTCNDCNNNKPTIISTCETELTSCNDALSSSLSTCLSLYPYGGSEYDECCRSASVMFYNCKDTATHHYMDCTKYADKYKVTSCEVVCDEPYETCKSDVMDDYDALFELCHSFIPVIEDYIGFVETISRRKLAYFALNEWIYYFYNGTSTCTSHYNSDHALMTTAYNEALSILPAGSIKTEISNKYSKVLSDYDDTIDTTDAADYCYGYTDDTENSFKTYVKDYFTAMNTTGTCDSAKRVALVNRMTTKYNAMTTKFIDKFVYAAATECMEDSLTFDVTFDGEFLLDKTHYSYPTWLSIDENQFDLVKSDNSHSKINNAEKYTSLSQYFTIKAWPGALPITYGGYLPRANFVLKLRNNSVYNHMYIDNLRANIEFSYYSDSPFVAHNSEYAEIFIAELSKNYTYTNSSGVAETVASYPIYLYTSDYPEEILKRYAYVVRFDNKTKTHYQDVVLFNDEPATVLNDIEVYEGKLMLDNNSKSYYDENKNDSRYLAKVITPTVIAKDDKYMNIWVEPTTNPNDPDTVFNIHVSSYPTTDTEHHIPIEKLHSATDLIQFYNVVTGDFETITYPGKPYGYATDIVVKVPRFAIAPVYYETLPQTYRNSASIIPYVIKSSKNLDEYPTISVNDYPTSFTIFNNGTLKFSDSLNNASDGIKTKDVFKFGIGDNNINKINLTTTRKCKVRFNVDYDIYKDVYSEADHLQ